MAEEEKNKAKKAKKPNTSDKEKKENVENTKKKKNNNSQNENSKKVKSTNKKERVKHKKEEKEVVEVEVKETPTKKDEFEIKQTITKKKENTGLKILGIIVLLAIVCLAGLYIKFVVIDKNTIGEVTKALMQTLSPQEKLFEALKNTQNEKNVEENIKLKVTEFNSTDILGNVAALLGKKELNDTIKGLEFSANVKKVNGITNVLSKLNYKEKSIIDTEIYQEEGKEGVAKFFNDEDLAIKLPKGTAIDTKKMAEYIEIIKELHKTYDSKYSEIIKYITENIIKIEEKNDNIIVRFNLENLKDGLQGLMEKIKDKPEFVIDTYKAVDKLLEKLEKSGDYKLLNLKEQDLRTTREQIKEILENITPEGIKEDAKEVIKDLEQLEKLGLKGNVELKFTLKDMKISKLETKIQIDKMVKIETVAEFKYGNAKIEKIKYNEEALKKGDETLRNVTTKMTMQILSLPVAQRLMQSVQGFGNTDSADNTRTENNTENTPSQDVE